MLITSESLVKKLISDINTLLITSGKLVKNLISDINKILIRRRENGKS